MNSGFIRLPRDIQDHWTYTAKSNKPHGGFDFGQAWIDLLLLANHTDVTKYVNGEMKTFKAGSVYRSQLELSRRWGWNDRKKVRRFLEELENQNDITFTSDSQGTVIRILDPVRWGICPEQKQEQ